MVPSEDAGGAAATSDSPSGAPPDPAERDLVDVIYGELGPGGSVSLSELNSGIHWKRILKFPLKRCKLKAVRAKLFQKYPDLVHVRNGEEVCALYPADTKSEGEEAEHDEQEEEGLPTQFVGDADGEEKGNTVGADAEEGESPLAGTPEKAVKDIHGDAAGVEDDSVASLRKRRGGKSKGGVSPRGGGKHISPRVVPSPCSTMRTAVRGPRRSILKAASAYSSSSYSSGDSSDESDSVTANDGALSSDASPLRDKAAPSIDELRRFDGGERKKPLSPKNSLESLVKLVEHQLQQTSSSSSSSDDDEVDDVVTTADGSVSADTSASRSTASSKHSSFPFSPPPRTGQGGEPWRSPLSSPTHTSERPPEVSPEPTVHCLHQLARQSIGEVAGTRWAAQGVDCADIALGKFLLHVGGTSAESLCGGLADASTNASVSSSSTTREDSTSVTSASAVFACPPGARHVLLDGVEQELLTEPIEESPRVEAAAPVSKDAVESVADGIERPSGVIGPPPANPVSDSPRFVQILPALFSSSSDSDKEAENESSAAAASSEEKDVAVDPPDGTDQIAAPAADVEHIVSLRQEETIEASGTSATTRSAGTVVSRERTYDRMRRMRGEITKPRRVRFNLKPELFAIEKRAKKASGLFRHFLAGGARGGHRKGKRGYADALDEEDEEGSHDGNEAEENSEPVREEMGGNGTAIQASTPTTTGSSVGDGGEVVSAFVSATALLPTAFDDSHSPRTASKCVSGNGAAGPVALGAPELPLEGEKLDAVMQLHTLVNALAGTKSRKEKDRKIFKQVTRLLSLGFSVESRLVVWRKVLEVVRTRSVRRQVEKMLAQPWREQEDEDIVFAGVEVDENVPDEDECDDSACSADAALRIIRGR